MNKKAIEEYFNKRIKQEQEESSEWIDRILNAESTEEAERVIKEYNKKKFGMTDEELNQKMEKVVNKTTPKPKNNKKRGKKIINSNQLWAQLNEETLKKFGYIK